MTHFRCTGVGAYCIRPTNGPVRGRMNLFAIHFLNTRNPLNQKPDTRWGVYNTPLPQRIKNLILFYPLNPIPEKDWIHRLPLNPIPAKNWIPH